MNRILFSDNGTFDDLSNDLKDYKNGSSSFVYTTTEDALYIGQRGPFNHLYFKMDAVNSNASAITLQIWNGQEFESAVDVVNETISSGASMGQSGFVSWSTDRDGKGWFREDTDDITPLNSLKIYDLFWVKITFSATFSAGSAFKWIGQKFSTDNELTGEYPMLGRSSVMTAFESGKTDWEEQQVRAAEIIVNNLISQNVIDKKGQILDKDGLMLASVSKVSEIIFNGLGRDYVDEAKDSRAKYERRISKGIFKIDKNENANIDIQEEKARTGFMNR